MQPRIDQVLAERGITLPDAPQPAANYVPFVQTGRLVHVSGQVPFEDGRCVRGRLGENLEIEAGYRAARLCGLALLAQLRVACDGNLDRVRRVVKLNGYVNATPDFTDAPKVVNGASDLMVEIFGEAGRHARAAVGVATLPLGAAVEVEGIFELD